MLKIGTQTAGWLSFAKPEESLERAKRIGFETMDLGFPHISYDAKAQKILPSRYDLPLEEFAAPYVAMKAAADKQGITVAHAHAPFPVWRKDEEEHNAFMMTVLDKVIRTCAAVGCPAIVVHPVTRSTKEKEWETNMQIYRQLMPVAKETGVKICLENLFTVGTGRVLEGVCADADEAVRYIDALNAEAGADCFGFCFDVGHANLLHKNICQYLEILGHRLTCLHIHDNDGQNDLHMAPYTQTRYYKACTCALDWEQFIAGLRHINYRGSMCFETFRVTDLTPKPLWDSALTHIINIGKYFRARILSDSDTDI